MQDLNDILAFAAVVQNNGFSTAARVLNRPKSSISRQVDRLERRLGVRLLERSTRRIRLTEVGSDYYARCQVALKDLEEADRDVARHRVEPVGVVRVTCPSGIAQHRIARIVPGFLATYPGVRLQIEATNRVADLIKDRIDVAIRARAQLQDEALTMRKLDVSHLIFVSSPDFARRHPVLEPADMATMPFLSFQEQTERPIWVVRGPGGASQKVSFEPILWTSEFSVLIEAACAGSGIALLPAETVQAAIGEKSLVRLLPGWQSEAVTFHLVFPTARGLRPAVRVFIDYVAANFSLDSQTLGYDPADPINTVRANSNA